MHATLSCPLIDLGLARWHPTEAALFEHPNRTSVMHGEVGIEGPHRDNVKE
jgi:hypothetical protein